VETLLQQVVQAVGQVFNQALPAHQRIALEVVVVQFTTQQTMLCLDKVDWVVEARAQILGAQTEQITQAAVEVVRSEATPVKLHIERGVTVVPVLSSFVTYYDEPSY
jgi:hypothetical protein